MLSSEVKIPLVDLKWQHREIADAVSEGWNEVLRETAFVLGPQVRSFELAFAEFSGAQHCVGVGSGTDALELAFRALGIGSGDEVILPANTFVATALAVVRTGARPVLVDCEDEFHLIDMEAIGDAVTKRTKAIVPVHLYGQMAPVEEIIRAFPEVPVVEDAAQSQGAERLGMRSGSVGHINATSFYPGKNIGAYGDAGAVLTNDSHLFEKVTKLRNWGSDVKYHHPEKGFNSRLDTLQSVVLMEKLARLDSWNEMRRAAADIYEERLQESGVRPPRVAPGNTHVWHLYVVQVENRDQKLKELNENGIGAGVHYPVPLHLQGALADLGYKKGSFPHSENLASRGLSLPIYPGITQDQIAYVAQVLLQ